MYLHDKCTEFQKNGQRESIVLELDTIKIMNAKDVRFMECGWMNI